MEQGLYIEKNRALPDVENFNLLRQQGLQYIESLCSNLWTDYNTHDPGITILEALCYAITELGYRTNFDIKDLIADANGEIGNDQAFFTAKNILSSATLTVDDYRKLLADIIGVKNAWLYPYRDEEGNVVEEPSQEIPFFAHCKKDCLVYEKTEHEIGLHGLYNVLLDLDETDEFGDLNTGNLIYQFGTEGLQQILLQLFLPSWDHENSSEFHEWITNATPSSISNISVSFAEERWTVVFDYVSDGDTHHLGFEAIILRRKKAGELEPLITTQFNDSQQLSEIFRIYQKKISKTVEILRLVKSTLHANRNLAEDFVWIKTICSTDVAFCADIEVVPNADIEEVYANVLFQLENYFNPEVKFYSLKEMLDGGISADEFFEGPILKHGFIKVDELRSAQVRRKIYVSDIINFIMDTPGVLAVKNVLLTRYDHKGNPVLPSQQWCMEIDARCKPVLNIFRSKVLFFKNALPFHPRLDETVDTLKYLHGLEQKAKIKGTADDLELPEGKAMAIEEYLSVQYEFPVTYGIGEAGLPSTSTDERRGQAKQLQAYLLFYDQILAGFFSQLSQAGDLFSLKPDLKQTYFNQYLKEVASADEIFVDPTLLESVFAPPGPGDTPAVRKLRSRLLETEKVFFDRRNRFLDHLMGRFAESFNDYVLMLYSYNNADEYSDISQDELIKDKITFLKDYAVISRDRGQAFDYLVESWDTDNVSGLEKRLCRLSGIDDFKRRFLFCMSHIEIEKTETAPAKFYFKVRDERGNAVLLSIKDYDTYNELEQVIKKLLDVITEITAYNDRDAGPADLRFEIWDPTNSPLAQSAAGFPDDAARDAAILDLINKMKKPCPDEGMHLVEHILLRPRFKAPVIPGSEPEQVYKLMQVCLGENCDFCGEEDPYSFRLSLILPYWHERFRSMEFRRYFENMARTEAPAHCMVKICWIDNTLMNEFEVVYREWLSALRLYEGDLIQKQENEERLRLSSNEMIDILQRLHSFYPAAQLHDCETGVSNPVLLGNTILGTYKF